MKASFYEYNIAMSGLFTAKANLNVVNHNLANAAIPGYSRQYTLQRASRPISMYDGKGMYGTGSEVYGIAQMRDIYLDRKYWHQMSVKGEYGSKNSHLAQMETMLSELSDVGILNYFNKFFDGLSELSTDISDATYRTNAISIAESLAEMVRSNAEALLKQQKDINREVDDMVTIINSLGNQIASLNKQIYQYEMDGSNANDLRDQRALLVDTLSEYVNVEVTEHDLSTPDFIGNKKYSVMLNGYDFVNHDRYEPLMVVPRSPSSNSVTPSGWVIPAGPQRNEMDAPGLYDIYFANSTAQFNIYSSTLKGSLKGLIDVRDGNNLMTTINEVPGDDTTGYQTTTYKGIPFYMNKLNTLVRTFARAMNEGLNVDGSPIMGMDGDTARPMVGHMYGYNYNGENLMTLLFTYSVSGNNVNQVGTGNAQTDFPWDANNPNMLDYSALNCLNFTINPQLVSAEGWSLLACSSDPLKGESHNDIILDFARLSQVRSLFKEGSILDFIIGTSDHLSIDKNQANNFEASFTEITLQTHNQRLSVSSVDTNEEILSMMKYNQMYQACAKLVNVINNIYDILINRLGV